MAAKIIANLLVAGGTVLFRAASQAYRQAIVNGTRAGMTAEGVQQAAKSAKQLTLREAEMILGVESGSSWQDVMKKYEHLMQANEKNGSFYLQSKVYRAKERLEQEFQEQGLPTDGPEGGQQQQQQSGGQ
ncbi:mitochondrial import inner membrane translocase subunit tim16-like isoform A [Chlorella sorokiniana]|uniref:Mitochondrial import inner membrane translocase subunit tim16-like isoform A n=1 Tax=Chlorella sorokiniana TaxID=3076 RepID=A0A2P6TND4_CHLSO|nr:mitochondrial import inner membrane translocase subunit tim16-like isoform A [Chlorella sorokiniana]|eukprot:PRW50845.1 mitochondrial import inner membrane translocase subunit tim16-like isoform A [Chlorella sorokiniana]